MSQQLSWLQHRGGATGHMNAVVSGAILEAAIGDTVSKISLLSPDVNAQRWKCRPVYIGICIIGNLRWL